MRRLYARTVTTAAILPAATWLLVGCGSGNTDIDSTVKPGTGTVMKSSGQPQDSADYAKARQSEGQMMNQTMQRDAAARAAAMARTGGK